MCCSVLQFIAVCCRVLQSVLVRCSILLCVAVLYHLCRCITLHILVYKCLDVCAGVFVCVCVCMCVCVRVRVHGCAHTYPYHDLSFRPRGLVVRNRSNVILYIYIYIESVVFENYPKTS